MTVSNQTNRISATGSGSTGQEVPFSFPITATSDLAVYKRIKATGVETLLAETTNYTVVISIDLGGTLTTVTAIETTEQIHIIRDTPNIQSLDLVQGGDFNAENIEGAIDKMKMCWQWMIFSRKYFQIPIYVITFLILCVVVSKEEMKIKNSLFLLEMEIMPNLKP